MRRLRGVGAGFRWSVSVERVLSDKCMDSKVRWTLKYVGVLFEPICDWSWWCQDPNRWADVFVCMCEKQLTNVQDGGGMNVQ